MASKSESYALKMLESWPDKFRVMARQGKIFLSFQGFSFNKKVRLGEKRPFSHGQKWLESWPENVRVMARQV